MNNYEEKKQVRIDRLKEAADKAEQRANTEFNSAHKMTEAIPIAADWKKDIEAHLRKKNRR